MPPKTSPRKDRAVAMVMAGKASSSAQDAADAVGLGPEAVQNIRKRVRHERARGEEQRVAAEEEGRLRTAQKKRSGPATDGPATKKKPRWRKTAHQTDLDNEDHLLLKRATDAAYKAATAEYEADIRANSGSKQKRDSRRCSSSARRAPPPSDVSAPPPSARFFFVCLFVSAKRNNPALVSQP
jgi:hypothetical protein